MYFYSILTINELMILRICCFLSFDTFFAAFRHVDAWGGHCLNINIIRLMWCFGVYNQICSAINI